MKLGGWCCDKKPISLSLRPGVLSLEAVGTYHCLSLFHGTHTGLAHTKVQSLDRDTAL